MIIDPEDLDARSNYKLLIGSIIPRPIAWVSTVSTAGVRNLAPVSFFTVVGRKPPRVSLSIQARSDGTAKDTMTNIRETGQFVTNMATFSNAHSIQRSAVEWEPDEDEFSLLDIDAEPSAYVTPPRVKSAPIALECEVFKIFDEPSSPGGIVWGTIVRYYIRDDIYLPSGRLDVAALDPIGRLAAEYSKTETVFVPPLSDEVMKSNVGRRMIRLDDHDSSYSPIETPTWTGEGSVREP
jgi:flavin reductase (DIM6/NTAB) family NADH-FMN oxidoreductase RutF